MDGSVVAHLPGQDLRPPGRPHARGQRIWQGQTDRGRYRGRASGGGKGPEESLLRNRILTRLSSLTIPSAADSQSPCAGPALETFPPTLPGGSDFSTAGARAIFRLPIAPVRKDPRIHSSCPMPTEIRIVLPIQFAA